MTTLSVDMGGISYRAATPDARAALALVTAVHEALTGLGLEPWVRVPADVHAPNLARLTTSRAGHE